ncbi:hypothetical protein pb186bvf_009230 [Paramecium bursaria]
MKKSERSQKEITKKSQKSLQAISHHFRSSLFQSKILQIIFNYYQIITAYNKNQKYINKNLYQALDQLQKYSYYFQ